MNLAAVLVCFQLLVSVAICDQRQESRLVCYLNSQSQSHPDLPPFNLDQADPFLCTHIIYAADMDQEYNIKPFPLEDKTISSSLNELKERNPALKTLLAVGRWSSNDTRLIQMSSNQTSRKMFVHSALNHLRQEGFDGLDVVWQTGAQRNKSLFTLLLKELRGGIQEEARLSERETLLLSTAVSGLEDYAREAYDAHSFPQYVDFISLVNYDLHGPLEGMPGHVSPLLLSQQQQPALDTPLSIDHLVQYWLSQGVDSHKLILGFPSYAPVPRILENLEIYHKDREAALEDDTGEYTQTAHDVMPYYEVCQFINSGAFFVQSDERTKMVHAYKDDQWLSFDNSLKEKMRELKRLELGGAMVWSLDLDDYTGTLCGQGSFPFTRLLRASLWGRHHRPHHRSRHYNHGHCLSHRHGRKPRPGQGSVHRSHPHRHGFLSHDSRHPGYHVHCHHHQVRLPV